MISSSFYRPRNARIGIQIPDKNQNTANTIRPIHIEVSIPIKIAPTNPKRVVRVVIMASDVPVSDVPVAIRAAPISPLLWFKPPQPLRMDANKSMMAPAVTIFFPSYFGSIS